MLWAQVLSRAVTECLSGSCSSREVMHRCTDCRKGLASAAERRAMSAVLSARTLARPTQPGDRGCQLPRASGELEQNGLEPQGRPRGPCPGPLHASSEPRGDCLPSPRLPLGLSPRWVPMSPSSHVCPQVSLEEAHRSRWACSPLIPRTRLPRSCRDTMGSKTLLFPCD